MKRYLTFSPDWVKPYESPWSIFQKLKSANLITTNETLKALGTDKVRNLKRGPCSAGNRDRDLYSLIGVDNERCKQIIGFSLVEYCLKSLDSLKNNLPHQRLDFFFRDNLYYCKSCMNYGYHSILFQLKFIHVCPFHETSLENRCPKCNNPISYILSDNGKETFNMECRCQFPTNIDLQDFRIWRMLDTSYVKSSTLNHWLNLTGEQKILVQSIYLLSCFNLERYPHFLDSLMLAVTDIDTKKCFTFNEVSANQIWNTCKFRDEERKITTSAISKVLFDPVDNFHYLHEKLYLLTKQTVSSIVNHTRKNLFAKHDSCIKRYVKLLKIPTGLDPPVCPYAYAYVHWKERIYSFKNFYDVDNRGRSQISKKENILFISPMDYEIFSKIIIDAAKRYGDKMSVYISKIGWLIQHILYHLLLNHLQNFLFLTLEYSRNNFKPNFYDLIYQNLNLFFFVWPKYLSDNIQFHWFSSRGGLISIPSSLKCPYSNLMSKRITPEEYSHYPLKIALNRMDKNSLEKDFYLPSRFDIFR